MHRCQPLRRGLVAFAGVLVSFAVLGPAAAQDDASGDKVQPVSDDQRIVDFKFQSLRMISPRGGPARGRVYWYMLYTLENPHADERSFFLTITAQTDGKRTYSDMFLPLVEREIERKEGIPLWGQVDRFEVLSDRKPTDEKFNYTTIRPGEKRRCVAVFNNLDPHASKIVIRVAGLYAIQIDTKGSERAIREKVRELHFRRAGDDRQVTTDSFELLKRNWVDQPVTPRTVER